MIYLVATLILSLISLLLYGTLIETKKYQRKFLNFSIKAQEKIKIAHISDIQISHWNKVSQLKKLVQSINKEDVDLIFLQVIYLKI